jgi:molybdopterin-guanine dinucleotide biosynthesis protein A
MRHDAPSAAILAGGRATRFGGRDKSALLVGGRTILEAQMAALAPLTGDLMIVGDVARPVFEPAPASDDRASHRQPPRVVPDLVPGCGPLGGLHAALTAARGNRVLLVACDMPFLSSPFAGYLLSLSEDADIVVPRSERGYHPLCAVYSIACLAPAATRLADGHLKMRELLDAMRTRVVPLDEIQRFGDPDRLLANVNTPADYADLEALQGHKL